jgi:hypothetical protein
MLRHELREGNWLQLSCRLLQYGLVARFSTFHQIIVSGVCPAAAAPNGSFPRAPKIGRVSFPSPAVYNRHFQSGVSEQER